MFRFLFQGFERRDTDTSDGYTSDTSLRACAAQFSFLDTLQSWVGSRVYSDIQIYSNILRYEYLFVSYWYRFLIRMYSDICLFHFRWYKYILIFFRVVFFYIRICSGISSYCFCRYEYIRIFVFVIIIYSSHHDPNQPLPMVENPCCVFLLMSNLFDSISLSLQIVGIYFFGLINCLIE